MVHQRIIGALAVAGAAAATVIIGNHLVQKAGGEETLPPEEENTPEVPVGSLGSVTVKIEDVKQFDADFFIFDLRYSNLANQAQTFVAIMQINQPNGQAVVLKITKITVEARSSRKVRFSSGNLLKLVAIRGIWRAEFFAWKSFEEPITLSDSVFQEFIVDVL